METGIERGSWSVGQQSVPLAKPETSSDWMYTPDSDVSAHLHGPQSGRLVAEAVQFARPSEGLVRSLRSSPLVLWRAVLTPNHELVRFLSLARTMGRPPLVWETPSDWFTPAVNPSKRALAKLAIGVGPDRHGAPRVRHCKDASLWEPGRHRIADVRCFDGRSLICIHHDLSRQIVGEAVLTWPDGVGGPSNTEGPRATYERAFALFTCMGALAESFVWEGSEKTFTEEVVLPAFEATVRRFGVKPRIVRLLPIGTETDPLWESYPAEVMPLARQAARRCLPS